MLSGPDKSWIYRRWLKCSGRKAEAVECDVTLKPVWMETHTVPGPKMSQGCCAGLILRMLVHSHTNSLLSINLNKTRWLLVYWHLSLVLSGRTEANEAKNSENKPNWRQDGDKQRLWKVSGNLIPVMMCNTQTTVTCWHLMSTTTNQNQKLLPNLSMTS